MSAPLPRNDPRPAWAFPNLWKAAAGLGLLVFLMFADSLLAPGTRLLGGQTTDMFQQFYAWREFGFGQLAKGNLPLWNPHIFSGAPYFGGVQAAMLYPVNWLLLVLPLAAGLNWTIALNAWMLGFFMYAWAGFRGLKPLACFMGGAILIFCGPHFIHVYAGHVVNLAVMTWAPLIFLAIDGLLSPGGRSFREWLGWSLLGMAAVAMQVFAGHPQYLFYTAVAAGIYLLLNVIGTLARRPAGATFANAALVPGLGLGAIYGGGSALAAVQLLTAFQAAGETVRSERVPYVFASMFGFPPENLLTLLNPYFFGDMISVPYWGRCYLWEMSLFIGVIGLALAVYGALYGKGSPLNRRWVLAAMTGVTFVLALGAHTPLFQALYDWAPGFGKFRGISKFTFQTALFAAMLAAAGLDALLRDPKPDRRFIWGVAAAGLLALIGSGIVAVLGPLEWREALRWIAQTRESYLPETVWNSLDFAGTAREFSALALLWPGLALIGVAAGLHGMPRRPWLAPLLAALGVAELFAFAFHTRETFDSRTIVPPAVREFAAKHPGDDRSLNLLSPNSAMSTGAYDLWGSDPGVVRRYAEFITWTQGGNPDEATQYVNFKALDPLYAMLRLRYAFVPDANGMRVIEAPTPPLAHVQLVPRARVAGGRDAIFKALREPGFDPRREAILETAPAVEPAAAENPGSARVTASSTDWLEVEAEVASPALLLVTDLFTPAWRASALPGSSQAEYKLQPANYILQAVPLAAGHHRLRIEYAPRAFTTGKWVSAGAWAVFLAAAGFFMRRRKAR